MRTTTPTGWRADVVAHHGDHEPIPPGVERDAINATLTTRRAGPSVPSARQTLTHAVRAVRQPAC